MLPAKAKKSIKSAIQTHAKTIILQEGNYRAGVNFKNGTSISDLNLIGEGRVIIDNMGANPLVIKGKAFIRNIEFIMVTGVVYVHTSRIRMQFVLI